jgi:hypothetical protein
MEPYASIQAAVVLFSITAMGGLLMAGMRLRGIPQPPAWLAMIHGLLATAGLTLLIYAAVSVGLPTMALLATGVFVLAGIGGAVMNLLFHWKQLPLPVPMMIAHGVVAVSGFLILLLSLYRPQQVF